MPNLRLYDQPQVQQQGLPGVRVANIQPVGITQGLATASQAVGLAGSFLEKAQNEADSMRVEEAANQLRQKQQDLTAGIQKLQGRQVLDANAYGGADGEDLRTAATRKFDAEASNIYAGLKNGRQQQMFKMAAQRFRLEFDGHVEDHLQRQTSVAAVDTYKGTLAAEDQTIAQNGVTSDGRLQGDTIVQSQNRKAAAARTLSAFLGESPDSAKARELEALSSGHATVLDSLLRHNMPQAAATYFDLNRHQMDARVVGAMEGRIKETQTALNVQAQADRISALGLPLDQQDAEARKVMAQDPDGMKLLTGELEHRFSVQRTAHQASVQDVTGRLWDMRFPTLPGQQGKSLPDIMRSPEWGALDGATRNELRAQWEGYSKRNENDPATMVAKFATYMHILDNPKDLMAMSDPQIVSYLGTLGPDLTKQLLVQKREAMGDYGKLFKATLNDIPIKDIAGEYGLKTKGNLQPADLAQLGMLRDKALEAIRDEQAASGKMLLPERKEEILRGLLTKSSTERSRLNPARWFGDSYTNDGKFLFQVNSFMELGATDAEKTQAVDYLVQVGAPITPANVQTMLDSIRAKKAQ